jgi:hypothetical protein
MRVIPNRARQLLVLREMLAVQGGVAMSEAIRATVAAADGSTHLQDRLTAMIVSLPDQVVRQAQELLDSTASKYMTQIDQVANHFRNSAFAGPTTGWFQVFDITVDVAYNAVADLVDAKLATEPVDESKVTDLQISVQELINEIKAEETLDDETKNYLLEISLHLLQVLQRFRLFGSEGIVDLQGHFLATMYNFHPDLVPESEDGGDKSATAGRRFAKRLWQVYLSANVVSGLPVNIDAIASMAHLALSTGH